MVIMVTKLFTVIMMNFFRNSKYVDVLPDVITDERWMEVKFQGMRYELMDIGKYFVVGKCYFYPFCFRKYMCDFTLMIFLHILSISILIDSKTSNLFSLNCIILQTFVEEMLRGLTKTSWERIDVNFSGTKQRYLAHNTIQVGFTFS